MCAVDWEKLFAKCLSNKGLLSTTSGKHAKLNHKKINDLIFKMDNGFEQTLQQRSLINGKIM